MLLKDVCNFLCHSIAANNHDIVCALDSTPLWHEQHGVVVPPKPGDAIPCCVRPPVPDWLWWAQTPRRSDSNPKGVGHICRTECTQLKQLFSRPRRHPVGDLSLSSIVNEHQCSNVMLSNPDSAWSCTQVTVQPICFNRLQKPRRPG